ncbi:hypothetical protein I4U23_010600 [Adineta vaga]|nr:hypothetical protein I4U23_010600 [Adineta vaga]
MDLLCLNSSLNYLVQTIKTLREVKIVGTAETITNIADGIDNIRQISTRVEDMKKVLV